MFDDTQNLNRKLHEILRRNQIPNWSDKPSETPSIEGLERAAGALDYFIDIIEEAHVGIRRRLVPSGELEDWNTPRKLSALGNETSFELSVNPSGGVNLHIDFEDKTIREYDLSFEETAMLLRSFAVLRMTRPTT